MLAERTLPAIDSFVIGNKDRTYRKREPSATGMAMCSNSPALPELRERIARLESSSARRREVLLFGVPEIDRVLPGGRLTLRALHEVASCANGAIDGGRHLVGGRCRRPKARPDPLVHHLSQHPGGFVLTHDRLDELVPIEPVLMADRQIIEWTRTISTFSIHEGGCFGARHAHLHDAQLRSPGRGQGHHARPRHAAEDPATYAMIRKADTVGVFQIESRAQMSMLPRIKPRDIADHTLKGADPSQNPHFR